MSTSQVPHIDSQLKQEIQQHHDLHHTSIVADHSAPVLSTSTDAQLQSITTNTTKVSSDVPQTHTLDSQLKQEILSQPSLHHTSITNDHSAPVLQTVTDANLLSNKPSDVKADTNSKLQSELNMKESSLQSTESQKINDIQSQKDAEIERLKKEKADSIASLEAEKQAKIDAEKKAADDKIAQLQAEKQSSIENIKLQTEAQLAEVELRKRQANELLIQAAELRKIADAKEKEARELTNEAPGTTAVPTSHAPGLMGKLGESIKHVFSSSDSSAQSHTTTTA